MIMIRVIFEFNEDVLNTENTVKSVRKDLNAIVVKAFVIFVGFSSLKRGIEKGKNEFLVTEEKLDEQSKSIYSDVLPVVCALAAYSETDKP